MVEEEWRKVREKKKQINKQNSDCDKSASNTQIHSIIKNIIHIMKYMLHCDDNLIVIFINTSLIPCVRRRILYMYI